MIISITNQKGGVGKTTTVINLGTCLTELKKRVLLIDLDPQAGLTVSLGFNPDKVDYTTLNFLNGEVPKILGTKIPSLSLIPANLDLATAEAKMMGQIGFEKQMAKMIAKITKNYDYIIIDCPPSLGVLTANALVAANHIIIPAQCEYLSMRALIQLQKIIDAAKEANPKMTNKILFTMYIKRTIHSEEIITEIKKHFPTYKTVITRTVRFAYSSVVGKPLVLFDRSSEQAQQYRDFAKEVLKG